MKESIEVMKSMWVEELANYQGEHFQLKNAILSPKPIQKPGPPIYIACNTSKRLMPRIAAQQGDALAMMWGHDETVTTVLEAFKEEWYLAGRCEKDLTALRSAYIVFRQDENEAKAREDVHKITSFPAEPQTASQAIVPEGSDADLIVFGRPETIAEQLQSRVFDMGFNEMMCSFVACDDVDVDSGGYSHWAGSWLGGMRLFAEEVMPLLQKN